MAKDETKVVIDTNIIVSALIFGGKPQEIIKLIIERKIFPITSLVLVAELTDVLVKKFKFIPNKIELTENFIKENFKFVHPKESIHISRDKDDNRVLEAAVEGECEYIITGDQDLLELKTYQNIKIVTPDSFLSYLQKR